MEKRIDAEKVLKELLLISNEDRKTKINSFLENCHSFQKQVEPDQ
jgi:hypothetical protein